MGSGKEYGVSHLNSYVNDKIRKEKKVKSNIYWCISG